VDIPKILEVLADHGILPRDVALTDEAFNYVRNGYISLRRRGLRSLEELLTAVGRYSYLLDRFCQNFPREAGRLIMEEVRGY